MDAGQEFELAFMQSGLTNDHMEAFGAGWIASAAVLTDLLIKENERILTGLRLSK